MNPTWGVMERKAHVCLWMRECQVHSCGQAGQRVPQLQPAHKVLRDKAMALTLSGVLEVPSIPSTSWGSLG